MVWVIGLLVYAFAMGFTTRIVISNKGYVDKDDSWFWWGFFFGIFALIVACAKPQNIPYEALGFNMQTGRDTMRTGDWECPCGRVNAAYVTTCTCGKNKSDVASRTHNKDNQGTNQSERTDESAKATAIREYKGLLDAGIITQEEFDAKKKQLLGL